MGVFRDTIIEADYNPLSAQKHTIKYSLRKIEDPLKRDVEKVYKEKMELGLVDMLGQQNLGKHTFDVKWWDKTYATPYGYDVNEDGTVRTFKEDPLAAKNKTSRYALQQRAGLDIFVAQRLHASNLRVAFDHYNAPRGKEVPDMEWETCGPKCRTSFAPGPEQRRNRQNLFETIQQGSNAYHDGRTLGDQWLEYRGKKVPPGPEMRRGRPDLFETFQMGSDPAVDKRSLGGCPPAQPQNATPLLVPPAALSDPVEERAIAGDSWLERKGKYMPPGPEQRRNRQDLFETFQEKSNPYQDGRPLGDLWLERKGKGCDRPLQLWMLDVRFHPFSAAANRVL